MEVVEYFESVPHKAGTFLVQKPFQVSAVVKMPRKSKAEGGKEEKDEED